MIIAAATLPLLPELVVIFGDHDSTAFLIASGALAVALAYLLGTVLDRLVDTFVDDLDRHHRARFAICRLLKHLKRKEITIFPPYWDDPYPEARLRTDALWQGGAVAEQMQYLRTRIRLTRSVAVILPALTLGLMVGVDRFASAATASGDAVAWPEVALSQPLLGWLLAIPAAYPLGLILAGIVTYLDRTETAKVPRTEDPKLRAYGEKRGYSLGQKDKRRKGETLVEDLLGSRLLWLYFAFCVIGGVFLVTHPTGGLIAIFLAGLVLALFAARAWWRISETFMDFLATLQEPSAIKQG